MIERIDWPRLYRALWRAVQDYDGRAQATAAEYAAAIAVAVRRAEGELSDEAAAFIADYVRSAEGLVREGLAASVAPTAAAAAAAGVALREDFVAAQVSAAYTRRWPDGLRLSQRVWNWGEQTRRGVSLALEAGIRLGRAQGTILMDMQRAIEAVEGRRFAVVTQQWDDWASRLAAEGRRAAGDPRLLSAWREALQEAEQHVETLRDGGTLRQARVALQEIREAVLSGKRELLDKRLNWWLYGRQQYVLKRIIRTELAHAQHAAVLEIGAQDQDVTGYRWRRSAGADRAEPCQCGLYATIDFGAGPGYWPRERVPARKPHPHCMCSLTPTTKPFPEDAPLRHAGVGSG